MATLLPNGKQQFLSQNGVPLASGTVFFYVPNTFTPKDTYQDPGGTVLNTNPILLDAAGEAIIYGSGSYRQQVFDSAGNLIWDQLTADTAIGGLAWGGTSTGTPNAQVIAASSFTQQDGQQISFTVGAGLTNTGPLTVAPGGGSGIPVLQDLQTGPTPLTGGEVVAANAVTLIYDQTRGAFHLLSEPAPIPPTTFQDGTFRIENTSDVSKQIAFDASGIATGTTQTLKAPNVSITVGDAAMFQGGLFGCTLSNDAVSPGNVLDIAAGSARDSTNVDNLILASAITKNTASAWSVGTGGGSLDTGTVGNNTYHVFLIMRTDTRVVDVLTSLSATSPGLPSNYTLFRRIGSIIRSGGSVQAFVQDGDSFFWNNPSPTPDFSGSRSKSALTVNLPSGIRLRGLFEVHTTNTTGTTTATLYDGVNTSIAVRGQTNNINSSNITMGNIVELYQYTNTSAQIQAEASGGANGSSSITTLGWVDTRGK